MAEEALTCGPPALTARSLAFLARAGRPDSAETPDRVAGRFTLGAGLPVFPTVVCAIYHFGGYQLPNGPGCWFSIHRAERAIRLSPRDGLLSDHPDRYRLAFGHDKYAQAWFLMDGHGRLYEG